MSVILPSVFKDGTATIANGGTVVTLAGALLVNAVLPGDFFGVHRGFAVRIASVDSDTQLTLANPWPGASQVAGPYEIMLQNDNSRMQESTRQLLERMQSGNLYSLAALVGVADALPIFTGAGVFGLVSKSDLTSGVDYDVQVDTLADRAAYNGNAAGFSVLVSNIGDGRTAIYSKKTNAPGDWSAPGYVTGPVGPMPTLAVSSTTTLTPGAPATVVENPVAGGYTLDFGIPAGKGFQPRGDYAGGTAYLLGDVVTNAGSSWVLTVASSTGNAPPVLPATSNAWWLLVAAKGLDGTGIGDMLKAIYDPTNINADAFARVNHTGLTPIAAGGTNASTIAAARANLATVGATKVQVFTSSGTYTPDPNMLSAIIECQGGGGGGGGNVASTSGQFGGGGGGGGGAYSKKVVTKATVGASQTVTVGAAGSASTVGANPGGTGGDTSVGTLCVAKGGVGGLGALTNNASNGGLGGAAASGTGDVRVDGQTGARGSNAAGATVTFVPAGGAGGSSFYGLGAPSTPLPNNGAAGSGYGAGGSAGTDYNGGANRSGGAGTQGIVIITEFCSA